MNLSEGKVSEGRFSARYTVGNLDVNRLMGIKHNQLTKLFGKASKYVKKDQGMFSVVNEWYVQSYTRKGLDTGIKEFKAFVSECINELNNNDKEN